MNTPFPSVQALEEMVERSARLRDTALAAMLDASKHGKGSETLDRLRDRYTRLQREHDALLAAIQREAKARP
jgi:hypothetical protein